MHKHISRLISVFTLSVLLCLVFMYAVCACVHVHARVCLVFVKGINIFHLHTCVKELSSMCSRILCTSALHHLGKCACSVQGVCRVCVCVCVCVWDVHNQVTVTDVTDPDGVCCITLTQLCPDGSTQEYSNVASVWRGTVLVFHSNNRDVITLRLCSER